MTKGEKRMITILALINFFNYVDRQIVFPLFHNIQLEFVLTDFQLGLIGSAFVIGFSLTTIPLGVLADRYARRLVIFGGVTFWSVMTFFSGLATNFKSLLFFRGLVGIGEASYAPASTAMIADNFPQKKRARVQGLYYVGMFAGGTIGAILGTLIVYYTESWRLAFFIVAIPGMILGISSLFLKDQRKSHPSKKFSVIPLFKNTAYTLIMMGGIFVAFTANAYVAWGVEFIRRYVDGNFLAATVIVGVTTLIASTIGILLGGVIADKLQEKTPAGRIILVSFSTLLSIPLLLLGLTFTGNLFLFAFFFGLGAMLLSFYFGPMTAVIQDVVPNNLRATSIAIYIFIIQLVGGSLAPAIVGRLSDIFDLRIALQIATAGQLFGGLFFLMTAYLIHHKYFVVEQEDF